LDSREAFDRIKNSDFWISRELLDAVYNSISNGRNEHSQGGRLHSSFDPGTEEKRVGRQHSDPRCGCFAEAQRLVIDRFYWDEAESGAAENRKQLRKLLRDCKCGEVAIVIIPTLDRLSRDVRIDENLFYRFDQLGGRSTFGA